jgi:hypothetical protein
VEFDSWKQIIYDANDTILESSWYNKPYNRLIDAALITEGKDPVREKMLPIKPPNMQHTRYTAFRHPGQASSC